MSKQLQEICNLIKEINKQNQKIVALTEELQKEQTKALGQYFKYKRLETENKYLKEKIIEQGKDIEKLLNENEDLKRKLSL